MNIPKSIKYSSRFPSQKTIKRKLGYDSDEVEKTRQKVRKLQIVDEANEESATNGHMDQANKEPNNRDGLVQIKATATTMVVD